jgi:hypothetical protein
MDPTVTDLRIGPKRLPSYWFESRRCYFAIIYEIWAGHRNGHRSLPCVLDRPSEARPLRARTPLLSTHSQSNRSQRQVAAKP